jgi:signal transduction histidine kinase
VNRIELMARARSLLRAKALHDELAHAKDELEAKNGELTRVESLKESLIQMVVHDLKNPLTAIMGNLELLLGKLGENAGRDRERIGRALSSSRSMMRMILDLLDISRLEENRLPLTVEAFDPASLLEERASEIDGLARAGGIEIHRKTASGLPPIHADRALVGRIIGNLLSNAIKHTPSGGSITLTVEREGDGVALAVEDTGDGIPVEFQPLLFQKFAQAQLRRHGLATDRGLGLAFCKLAAEAHGGSISVRSEVGQGSRFRLLLPHAFDSAGTGAVQREPELVGAGV